jgi:hypothetical protein
MCRIVPLLHVLPVHRVAFIRLSALILELKKSTVNPIYLILRRMLEQVVSAQLNGS